ncbi:hypothetical protein [Kangiella japonica]|uniref:hypothetical protein n=1 Tax=Kangiella japonica TaxID=647384 RepID=UPI0031D621C8
MNKKVILGFVLSTAFFSAPNFAAGTEVNVTIKLPHSEQQNSAVRLFNYHLNRYQIIRNPFFLSRKDCLAYLPKNRPQVIKVFELHISKGREPYRALVFTHFAMRS